MKVIKKYLLILFVVSIAFILNVNGIYANASNENHLYLGGFTAGFNVSTAHSGATSGCFVPI